MFQGASSFFLWSVAPDPYLLKEWVKEQTNEWTIPANSAEANRVAVLRQNQDKRPGPRGARDASSWSQSCPSNVSPGTLRRETWG